jgi:zinc transport system permease protein
MLDFLQFEFMQRALLAGILISILAPLVGVFIVVKRYSILVDTLSHVSLLGIILGLLFGLNPYLTSTLTAITASIAIEKVKDYSQLYQESILSMFLSGALAISIIIISSGPGFNVNLISLLFGSVTTVTWNDIYVISGLSAAVGFLLLKNFRTFFLIAFDEDLAIVAGIKTKFYNYLLIVLAAITISLAIRIIGVLLISALMVIPVITALQLKKSFKQTTLIAILVSFSSTVLGLISSFYLDWASGGTIVLFTLFFFFLSFIFSWLKKSR